MNNYVTIAWRNLQKNSRFSMINIAGLTIGIAATLLIFLWVYHERNWDRHNDDYANVYHVFSNRNFNGEINTGSDMMYPLAQAAMESFPEVKAAAVVSFESPSLYTVGDVKVRRSTVTSSPHFFDIFTAEFIEGSAIALRDPDAVILTASTARILFGPGLVAGKTVKVDNDRLFTVKAVVADPPSSSTMRFEAILPFNPSDQRTIVASTDWINCGNRVYFKTGQGANIAELEKKTIQLIRSRAGAENPTTRGSVVLHPMAKWRLYEEFVDGKNTGGRIAYVRLFSLIAIVILIIACINFMNLSTARSEKRAKEVGVRKTMGSGRGQLVWQFMIESIVLATVSCILAVIILVLLKDRFAQLLNMSLALPMHDPFVYAFLGLLIVITGIMAGSYPAVYLSGFNPVKVLKGTFLPGKNALMPRKILVTAQFVVSIVLISAALIIYQQINYVKNREIGYNPDNLIMISSNSEIQGNYEAFRNDLMATGLVQATTRTSGPVTDLLGFTSGVAVPGAGMQASPVLGFLFAYEGFAQTVGVNVLEGRDFRAGDTNTVILNRAALQLMSIKDPIDREITWAGRSRRIVGIIDDMVMGSPYEKATPVMIAYGQNWSSHAIVRLRPGADPRKAIASLEGSFNRHSPSFPFEYRFVDEAFNEKFINEQLIGKLAILFTCLAIFVCCLGLFGLVSFTIERRNKEIGIRKVLGASRKQLLYLMSREFLILVGIAFLISIPAAWWGLSEWLSNYAYRTEISPALFLGVGTIILSVALITIGLNASQAALKNPVNTLRTE